MTHGEEMNIGGDGGPWQRLARRAIARWRLLILRGGVLGAGAMFVVLLPFVSDEGMSRRAQITVVAAIALVAVGVALVWPSLQYRHWRYRLADDALELERGVIMRHRSVIPYTRVQQIDINRSLIDRVLGLSVAKLLTASSGTDAKVPGLTPEAAETFRRTVLSRAGRDDAV